MDDPPHVDGSFTETLLMRETVHVFRHQQSLMGRSRLSDRLCGEKRQTGSKDLTGMLLGKKCCSFINMYTFQGWFFIFFFSPLLYTVWVWPMKLFQDWGSLDCLQFPGQAIRTELCFIPPSPADWTRWEMPSRRFDDTTTWQKPFVFSAAMADFIFYSCK